MLTKAQFIQALRDNPVGENDDPYATLVNLSEGGASVDYDVNASGTSIVVSAALIVELQPEKSKGKKGDVDGEPLELLEVTGFAILTSASMIEVEKAEQNALRNAINIVGGVAEYIQVAQPVNPDPVVKRPVAQPQNGVVEQAQQVATAAANGAGPICQKCNSVIEGQNMSFGWMDADRYAAWTAKKNNGVQMCKACNNKAYAQRMNNQGG